MFGVNRVGTSANAGMLVKTAGAALISMGLMGHGSADTDWSIKYLVSSTWTKALTVNPSTGQVGWRSGTVGAPGLTPIGDADTGFWSPAANSIAISAGGSMVARFDSNGNIGFGVSPGGDRNISVGGVATGAATVYGIRVLPTVAQTVTGSYNAMSVILVTEAASFNLGIYRGFLASQATLGAGSSVTTVYGFQADNSLAGSTTTVGYHHAIAAGTGRWGFHGQGTAANFLAGQTTFASTATATSPTSDSSVRVMGGLSVAGAQYLGGGLSVGGGLSGDHAAIVLASLPGGNGGIRVGPTAPLLVGSSFLGFNLRFISGTGWAYGVGSSGQWGALINFNPSNGTLSYQASGDAGNAGSAATIVNVFDATSTRFRTYMPLWTAASVAEAAGFRIYPGVAPTSPTNGDVWNDGSDLFVRFGGANYKLSKVAA